MTLIFLYNILLFFFNSFLFYVTLGSRQAFIKKNIYLSPLFIATVPRGAIAASITGNVCSVVWCGVVWGNVCGVVWGNVCGVVWCGVVWGNMPDFSYSKPYLMKSDTAIHFFLQFFYFRNCTSPFFCAFRTIFIL